ncbi:MAG: YbaK/EbsC family protein [Tenericutes bacterium]|nr:YbaK/EbsC family protein [Mycoplasmatota bacterium]
MSLTNVKEYFKKYNIDNRIIEFDVSSATVELAAKALNTEEKRIAKTLALKLKDKYILIVLAGDAKINNSKYKSIFHEKASMLSFDDVQKHIGHNVGGVCPFAIKENIDVYLDESLKRFDTVFPACGSESSAIELTIKELEKYSNYISWIDISSY